MRTHKKTPAVKQGVSSNRYSTEWDNSQAQIRRMTNQELEDALDGHDCHYSYDGRCFCPKGYLMRKELESRENQGVVIL